MAEKDRPISWLILAASFLSLTLSLGIPLSFGIFFTVLLDHFKNDYGKADVAAIGSIAYGILNLSSPIATWLYKRYGCRFVVTCGGGLASLGLFLSFFANSPGLLYFTYGVLTGFGFGFVYAPALTILPEYFERYRYFATSFATVGSAVGTMFLPRAILALVERYSWRGAMLIMSSVSMHVIAFGAIMRNRFNRSPQQAAINNQTWTSTLELELFRNGRFYLLCLDSLCFGGCSYTTFMMINTLITTHHVTIDNSAWLVSILGVSNIGGRLLASFLGQHQSIDRSVFFASFSLACSASTYALASCDSFWSYTLCLIVFGFNYGCRISQVSGMLIDNFGVNKMAAVLGYYFFAGGIGALTIPPLAGILADLSSISTAILFAASVNLFDSLICFVVYFLKSRSTPAVLSDHNPIVQFSDIRSEAE